MRIHGSLKKWVDDRGFGFIASSQIADEIFVHISAFPKNGERPKVGELVSFETQTDKNGKIRAIRVQRPGSSKGKSKRETVKLSKKGTKFKIGTLVFSAVIFTYIGYNKYTNRNDSTYIPEAKVLKPAKIISSQFKCDGRQYCSQMDSREEAKFFIRNCPDTKMDGDHDGIPCENDSRF